MRIAVTYDEGKVFQHFGHSERFKVYNIKNNKVESTAVVNTNGTGHGALADLLKNGEIDILICGGIGGGAQQALAQAGIKWFGGVQGEADQAVEDYLQGKLNFDPIAKCDHHGEDHPHQCGDDGCGKNCSH